MNPNIYKATYIKNIVNAIFNINVGILLNIFEPIQLPIIPPIAHKNPSFQSIYLFFAQKKLVVSTIGNIHIIDVALASFEFSLSKYVNAGTSINPPPVENNPEIKPS